MGISFSGSDFDSGNERSCHVSDESISDRAFVDSTLERCESCLVLVCLGLTCELRRFAGARGSRYEALRNLKEERRECGRSHY